MVIFKMGTFLNRWYSIHLLHLLYDLGDTQNYDFKLMHEYSSSIFGKPIMDHLKTNFNNILPC